MVCPPFSACICFFRETSMKGFCGALLHRLFLCCVKQTQEGISFFFFFFLLPVPYTPAEERKGFIQIGHFWPWGTEGDSIYTLLRRLETACSIACQHLILPAVLTSVPKERQCDYSLFCGVILVCCRCTAHCNLLCAFRCGSGQ